VEAGIESQALEARSGVVVAGGSRRRAVIRRLADAVLHLRRRRKGPSSAWRVALLG
jgi:hypothetical protein